MRNTRYFCDRCGREKHVSPSVDFKVGEDLVRDVAWITLRSKSGYQRDIDLCENCMNDLVSFWKYSQQMQLLN